MPKVRMAFKKSMGVKMINRCFILLTLFLTFSISANEDWIKFGETDASLFEGRAGSRIFSKTKSGKDISVASGRILTKKDRSIEFVKWYVSAEDCNLGFGKMITLDMQGNYKFENDFVEKGGTVASSLAAMLCFPLVDEKRERAGKGI